MGTKRRLFPLAFLLVASPLANSLPLATASDIPAHHPDRVPADRSAPILGAPEAVPPGLPALDVESLTRSVAGLEAAPATPGLSPGAREPLEPLLPADAAGSANIPLAADLPPPGLVNLEPIAGTKAPLPAEPRGDAPPGPPRRFPIPEPASVLLVLTGLIGLIARGRLRRNLER